MGFHVELNEGDRSLVRAVKSSPEDLFHRPYLSYLLFLATSADTEVVRWLRNHALELDIITGSDIAFAVFSSRIEVTLRVAGSAAVGGNHPPRPRSALEGKAVFNNRFDTRLDVRTIAIDAAARTGHRIESGDTLAITRANTWLAQELDLLDRMPCMVVLNMVPHETFTVYGLKGATNDLLSTLRKATVAFRRSRQYDAAARQVGLLEKLDAERNRVHAELLKLQSRMNSGWDQRAMVSRGTAVLANDRLVLSKPVDAVL